MKVPGQDSFPERVSSYKAETSFHRTGIRDLSTRPVHHSKPRTAQGRALGGAQWILAESIMEWWAGRQIRQSTWQGCPTPSVSQNNESKFSGIQPQGPQQGQVLMSLPKKAATAGPVLSI